jgi:hypothetical protein
MTSADTSETIATYTVAGKKYEIDHLGINYPDQWGEFAVFHDGLQVTEFGIEEMCLATVRSPQLMPTADDLIKLALQAVAEDTDDPGPVYPQPGAPIPLELNGGMAGYVVGKCGHRVAESEWRAGFRNCERDGG